MNARSPIHRCAGHVLLACAVLFACGSVAAGVFAVNAPWVRPASRGQATEAFMELTSSDASTLVGARAAVARRATLRGAKGPVESIALPAGKALLLAPAGLRIALGGLDRTLHLGDRVSITLVVRRADGTQDEIPVDAEVRRRSPIDDERRAHHH
jgi:copper(I)-binding protein